MTSYDARRVFQFPQGFRGSDDVGGVLELATKPEQFNRLTELTRWEERAVDPTALALQTTSPKRRQSSQNASSPLSRQSLTLLGKWLECAPKDRLCSILKKLCEEQAIAHEVFNAMTAHDIEAKLTDIISEGDESKKDGNAGGVRGDLAIPRGLQQKEIVDTGTKIGSVARKRKTKQHNADDE